MARSALLLFLLATSATGSALAQDTTAASGQGEISQTPSSVKVGDKVRVSGPTLPQQQSVGVVKIINADSIVLERDSYPKSVAVPVDSVSKLEVTHGKKRHTGLGIGLGIIVGAVAFGVAASGSVDEQPCEGAGCVANALAAGLAEPAIVTGAVVGGALLGGLLGGIIGHTAASDKWETVPLPELAAGVDLHGNVTLSISVRAHF
jgi:hypothetical protein